MNKNNTVKMIRIVICKDCGKEFETERPKVELCDDCRAKRYELANQRKLKKPKEKSKAYLSSLSKAISFSPRDSKHPYGKSTEEKAIEWHVDWLRWAKSNGVASTREYEVTKYALDCIMECKKARQNAMMHGKLEA